MRKINVSEKVFNRITESDFFNYKTSDDKYIGNVENSVSVKVDGTNTKQLTTDQFADDQSPQQGFSSIIRGRRTINN